MKFVKDVNHELWPVSKIVSISDSFETASGTYQIVRDVEFEDGRVKRISETEFEALKFQTRPTFAALPGTYRIQFEDEKRTMDSAMLVPVVGWQIDDWGTAVPICTSTTSDDGIGAVLMPDGKVTDHHGGVFNDIGKFFEFHAFDGDDE